MTLIFNIFRISAYTDTDKRNVGVEKLSHREPREAVSLAVLCSLEKDAHCWFSRTFIQIADRICTFNLASYFKSRQTIKHNGKLKKNCFTKSFTSRLKT